jgi:hypothetical protein
MPTTGIVPQLFNVNSTNLDLKKSCCWALKSCSYPDMSSFQVTQRLGIKFLSMKMAVFWVFAPCSLVEVCRRFRGGMIGNKQLNTAT